MNKHLKSWCLLGTSALPLPFATSIAQAQPQTKPNIVVVMADDIGLGDIGFYARQRSGKNPVVETPNLDGLIGEGMRFSDAHSPAALCAPTRYSMLTGNWPYRNYKPFGVWNPPSESGIAPDFPTSARLAKAGGYTTAFMGKWGLGGVWDTWDSVDYEKISQGALSYGFDTAYELPQGIQNEPFAIYEDRVWQKMNPNSTIAQRTPEQLGYADSMLANYRTIEGKGDSFWDASKIGPMLANKAVDYIQKQTAQKSAKPFFLYYCSQAVHAPHVPPAELNGVKIAGSTPGKHGDMIRELDVQVGMMVDELKKTGAYQNTLFVFTSDNGGLSFDTDMKNAGHNTSNGYRNSKGSIYEGGHRVPFIAVWPGKIRPNTNSDETIVGMDVVATIAAIAGQPIARDVIKDSIDLMPILTGTGGGARHQYLMTQALTVPNYSIREGDWKLLLQGGDDKDKIDDLKPVGLFNLQDNPFEKEADNLVKDAKYAPIIARLAAKFSELRASGDPTVMPAP